MFDVALGGSGFVAIGYAARPTMEATTWLSPDGVTWERNPLGSATSIRVNAVAWDGQQLILVGEDRSDWDGTAESLATAKARAAVWTSTDGRTWTRVPHTPVFDVGGYIDTMEDPATGGMSDIVAGPPGSSRWDPTCTRGGPANRRRGRRRRAAGTPGSESPTCKPVGRAQVRCRHRLRVRGRWVGDMRLEPGGDPPGLPGRDHAILRCPDMEGAAGGAGERPPHGHADRRPVLRHRDERSGDRLGERRRQELDAPRGDGRAIHGCPGQCRRVALRRGQPHGGLARAAPVRRHWRLGERLPSAAAAPHPARLRPCAPTGLVATWRAATAPTRRATAGSCGARGRCHSSAPSSTSAGFPPRGGCRVRIYRGRGAGAGAVCDRDA